MKVLLKAIFRPLWRLAQPLRQRVMARFDQLLTQRLVEAMCEFVQGPILPRLDLSREMLQRIESSVAAGRAVSENVATDTNLLLDSLVREIGRLQMQIEALHDDLDELRGDQGLALVTGPDEESVEDRKAG
jgi:hypothetical protein